MTSTDDPHRVDPATGAPAASPGTAGARRRRIERHLPRVRDLAPLLQFKKPSLPGRRQRLESALTIWDLRAIAARRT
ncbi:alpha-hydroxy-acid oxidizing enzyme, partial [Curtobacterium sp. 'Ferrero']